jgi:RHS repeat-associated protein
MTVIEVAPRSKICHAALLACFLFTLFMGVMAQPPDDERSNKIINTSTASQYVYRKSIKLIPGAKAINGFKATIAPDLYNEPVPSKNIDGETTTGNDWNYIYTRMFRKPVNNANNFESDGNSMNGDVIEQVQYFDGLGRLKQTVDIKGSPEKNDLVMPVQYDDYGREKFSYLPYSTSGDGGYRALALPNEQNSFYSPTPSLNGLDEPDNRPYAETTFESSPLNRVFFVQGPGSDWNGKKTSYEYGTNSVSTVILWQVNNTTGACTRSGDYGAGQLYRTLVTDENGNKTTEYKDKLGQVVLKETELGAKTYYVYDDFGLLRFVIPPEAVIAIGSGGLTDLIRDTWCYCYKYDDRKRMIEKKLPGVDAVYMVYDKRDRLILTQDGNLRAPGTKKWLYTKYDELNRPVVTGLYTGTEATQQAMADAVKNNTTVSLNEVRTASNYSTQLGYTTTAFPAGSPDIQTVTYYDDYDFDNNKIPDRKYYNEGLTAAYSGTKNGLVTGSRAKILDDTTPVKYVENVQFYDKYGRVVQTLQIQPIDASNVDTLRLSSQINLLGEVLQARTTNKIGNVVNTILDKFTLDQRGRILEATKKINNEPEERIISKNTYNQLGQLYSENLGVSASGSLQKIDYLYNIRGWLRGLNSTPETSDLFAMQLFYNDCLSSLVTPGNVAKANYNGNISAIRWTNKNLGTVWKAYGFKYDVLNRLNDAIYGEYNQAGTYSGDENKGKFDEYGITYDLNGNIKTLNRRGIDNPASPTIFALIDQLSYDYSSNGNKLRKLDDAMPDIAGRGDFIEKATTETEYYYDANGNMYQDDNKGITNIAFNQLNLPKQVNFTAANDYIKYIYTAGGVKLKKIVVKGGTVQFTENYAGAFVYKTTGATFSAATDLQYVIAEKGRLVKSGTSFKYEYYLKDHLGNTRVVFTDDNGNSTLENNSSEIPQYADYYPFGMLHSRGTSLSDDNRRLYNGKELQSETFNLDGTAGDETLFDWYDYGARFYDPQIGRWHSIDPLAEKDISISPYNYVSNNPILLIDPTGESTSPYYDENGNYLGVDEKGFSGQIMTTSQKSWKEADADKNNVVNSKTIGEKADTKKFDNNSKLTDDAKVNVISHVLSNTELPNGSTLKRSDFVLTLNPDVDWGEYFPMNYNFKTSTHYLNLSLGCEWTVENVRIIGGIHEIYGHGIMRWGDRFGGGGTHYKIYQAQMDSKYWLKSTNAAKRNIVLNWWNSYYYDVNKGDNTNYPPKYMNNYYKYAE